MPNRPTFADLMSRKNPEDRPKATPENPNPNLPFVRKLVLTAIGLAGSAGMMVERHQCGGCPACIPPQRPVVTEHKERKEDDDDDDSDDPASS